MCVCVQPPHKDHQIVSLYHYDERNYKIIRPSIIINPL